MKKWIMPLLLVLLLAACNNKPLEGVQANDDEDPAAVNEIENENEKNTETDEEEELPASADEQKQVDTEEAEGPVGDEGNEEEDESGKNTEQGNTPQHPHQYTLDQETSVIKPIGNSNPEVVLLTIDDAPDRYALDMANTLKELNVKAIFFVNGHFLQTEEEQAILREIHEMGFIIGNHTMNHKSLRQLTEEEQYKEIMDLNDLVEEIIGERPKFFRAPFGINTDYSNQLVAQEGMIRMNWTYGYDWEPGFNTAEAIADIMVNTESLQSGANLLMHDREWTSEALADIVKGIQEKGFEIVDPSLIKLPSEE